MSEAGNFEPIIRELRRQEEVLKSEINGIAKVAREKRSELKQVQGAVTQLLGKSKPKIAGERKLSRPAPNKLQVEKEIVLLLQERTVLMRPELEKLVRSALTKSGYSMMGFALRFNEALTSHNVKQTSDGYQLAIEKVG